MRFAISIPQDLDDHGFDPDAFRAFMRRAEELGFDSAWTQEQVLGNASRSSPLEAMTFAAACTERIRLGCSVFVTPLHSPVHLAKSLSTLDQFSRGRVEVGVGSGGPRRMFSAFNVAPDALVTRFVEGVNLMKACWTQSAIEFDGRFWQLRDAAMEPKPFQKPHPPIWFGGGHPNALRRAVEHGDGFFGAGSATTERFVEQARIVREALAESDRDTAGFRIAKRVYVGMDDDADRARERASAALQRLYGRDDMTPVAVTGPPDACARGLLDVVDAGAELVLLTPLFDDAEQMERFAAEVIPEFG